MRYFYTFFLLFLMCGGVCGQTIRPSEFLSQLAMTDPVSGSRTTVGMDARLSSTLNREQSLYGKMVRGHRIYIFIDNSQNGREKALEVINRFRNAFPDIQGDTLIYHIPDWKVAVGNCLTKDEAVIVFGRVKGMFESAVIREENIPLRNFLSHPAGVALRPEETEEW